MKSQWLPGPHRHVPFSQVPEHSALSPAQSTWQGPFEQWKAQLPPRAQLQLPFAHVPVHESPLQSTWHRDAAHVKSQSLPEPHVQSPLPQAPVHSSLFPSQTTWHGGSSHSNSHDAPDSHTQVPSSQSSSHPARTTLAQTMTATERMYGRMTR